MKTIFKAGLAITVGCGMIAGAAIAQDDDWEFQQDTARNITIAAARYDAGQIIVVQCRDNKLTAVLAGLPRSDGALQLQATRADGRAAAQTWRPGGAPGAYSAASPGRAVRFMKGGGLYSVRTATGAATAFQGAFDLPSQSANLDRVLTACGWATEDDRDGLAEATEVTTVDPDARRRVPSQRGATSRSPRREIPVEALAAAAPPMVPEQQVSCIVRSMHLRDCRADHAASAALPELAAVVRASEGREVYAVAGQDASASEGRVVHLSGGRITVIDYITTGG